MMTSSVQPNTTCSFGFSLTTKSLTGGMTAFRKTHIIFCKVAAVGWLNKTERSSSQSEYSGIRVELPTHPETRTGDHETQTYKKTQSRLMFPVEVINMHLILAWNRNRSVTNDYFIINQAICLLQFYIEIYLIYLFNLLQID